MWWVWLIYSLYKSIRGSKMSQYGSIDHTLLISVCRCVVRLGKHYDGRPNWCNGFRMLRKGGVIRLFIHKRDGRPNR